ncbi:MAG: archaeal proteasome endopeptidase complex subunit beta [Candidatus Parvarchaeota archaeon]|nr:archaeal proteasome endopeptidase complex subunit beta [Candidatus Jingweiarchaeum tengchongense]MCW1298405.1 archaeal proteasome endopeptidase complex subunit beta [Candidatus Jingweiarchaeum tengchongense]MCW1300293.1 archaeal proteasome endopeptidase complex subunit beta [Candidatus Jingweiarchaeum tengchongense]MCW1304911.1 archaeal proteasome endopeptidase complex subunit beta [Candidatus Jingweiarchaeum tengchongense]MCW1306147.1 archaeal proteasome endopeptidase complex subunit beta [
MKGLMKTGTTTLGIVTKDGIVFAADKRVTMDYLIAHKVFEKIFEVTDRIALTMAGLVGDAQLLAKFLKIEMELYKVRKQKKPSVKAACTLLSHILFNNRMSPFPYYVQILLGGVDETGFHLFSLAADGGSVEDKYISTGSGSVIAYGVLEEGYKEGMSLEEGIKLAVKAVNAAMQRDVYSGNGIDVVTITKQGFKRLDEKEVNKILSK